MHKIGQQQLTVEDLVDYIETNHGFPGWSRDQIAFECYRSAKDETMLYHQDDAGNLTGVVTGRKLIDPDTGDKVMHISYVLTTEKGVLLRFFNKFLSMYPDYKIMRAQRNKKMGGKRTIKYPSLYRFGKLLTSIS